MNGMKTDSDHGQPDNREWASDSRHRETVAVGIMSMATIVLVGMFGLLEILGEIEVQKNAEEFVKRTVET